MQYDDITNIQRAAVLLVSLGDEISPLVLQHLTETEIELITLEIANLRDISPAVEEAVLKDASDIMIARQYISQGGVDYARGLLEKALGREKTNEILRRLEGSLQTTGFGMLRNIDPKQLINFIQNEHPQTISLIMTQLPSHSAAAILSDLAPEVQADVSYRIATMEKISPDVINELEVLLERQFEDVGAGDLSFSGGTKTIAEILNLVETSAEKGIMETLESENPDLASEIKNLMFVFEDIILLDNRSIQRILKEVETKDLAIALKAASEEVKEKIFTNISERVAAMIKEEMEFMGPMRLSDVEAVQQKIVEVIRRLQEEGQIIITGRGGKEELVV
ncbi:MAG: flagellar motor switch protein FliG [Candidatus Zixiibacteriota bacterium]|nr:MAG: flagellar motor switch protein FliG [candidate division Zixibacteria bacterium]